ncbi:MAG: HAD family hydrolase [Proteobacteria bacterium]|nr:HAD family hydrolase [Pseudomonadota bacterium]
MSFDLIIFDCDGVLVDSEVISCSVHAEVLTRNGYPITSEQVFDRFLGRSARQAMIEVEAELGRSLPEDFDAQLKGQIFRTFTESLAPTPHIHDALAAITQRVCVASSGSHERMRISLGRTSLYDRFAPNIFSSSEVRNGKPAPDLFLYAAERMGVSPQRCLVVEDSVSGVAAAVAAGMTVLGYCGGSHCRAGHAETLRLAGATATSDDMRQLPGLIAQLGRKAGLATAI